KTDIGTLFLPKALLLTRKGGRVSLVQSAAALLFNQNPPAKEFREKLLLTYQAERVVNLSALRFVLFPKSVSPPCYVTFRAADPTNDETAYICPKPLNSEEDNFRILVEPQDIALVAPHEPAAYPWIWTVLMWGGRRDLAFIRRLSKCNNLAHLEENAIAKT